MERRCCKSLPYAPSHHLTLYIQGHHFPQSRIRVLPLFVASLTWLDVNFHCSSGPEIWNVDNGRMVQQGKTAVIEEAFQDAKSPRGSGHNTPVRSRLQTPLASAAATPVGSGAEDAGALKLPVVKKKKMTRNQLKAQEERRRLRKLQWLTTGGPKPEDTDSD